MNKTESSAKQRIEWIDTAKGICITLVMFHHVFIFSGLRELINPHLYYFLSSFRMPLYFALTGIFFKTYGSFHHFIIKKTNKLVIPFFFFFLTLSVLLPYILIRSGITIPYTEQFTNVSTPPTLYELLFDFYRNSCNLINGPLWFLLCLFFMNIIFFLIHYIAHKPNNIYLISIALGITGLLLGFFQIRLPLTIDTALTCMPFMCFGYFVRHQTQLLYSSRLDKHLLFYIVLFAIPCMLIARHTLYWANSFYHTSYFTAHLCGISGTTMVLLLSKKTGKIPLISFLGRFSIIVLCTHMVILKAIAFYLPFNLSNVAVLFIVFFILIAIELILIRFFTKYLPYVTAQKDLIRYKY